MDHCLSAGTTPLIDIIREKAEGQPNQCLSFRDYMELCLYHPVYGYYTSYRPKVGLDGDFYTSSHIGTVLGDILARFALKQFGGAYIEHPQITEWGAGTGRLAHQILTALQELAPDVYQSLTYRIVEISPHHREVLMKQLEKHMDRVVFVNPDRQEALQVSQGGLVFSNELLDAFPVHRVRRSVEGLMELYVRWNPEKSSLEEWELPCTDPKVVEHIEWIGLRLEMGQIAELNLEAPDWIRRQGAAIQKGTLLTIDYGDVASELYSSHRMNGTLLCYRQHQAKDNPLEFPGEQDITAHVDFTACIQAGEEAGFPYSRLVTQKEFLVENGVLELLQEHGGTDPFSPAAKRNRSIRQLLLTDQMSELFKVLVQKKG